MAESPINTSDPLLQTGTRKLTLRPQVLEVLLPPSTDVSARNAELIGITAAATEIGGTSQFNLQAIVEAYSISDQTLAAAFDVYKKKKAELQALPRHSGPYNLVNTVQRIGKIVIVAVWAALAWLAGPEIIGAFAAAPPPAVPPPVPVPTGGEFVPFTGSDFITQASQFAPVPTGGEFVPFTGSDLISQTSQFAPGAEAAATAANAPGFFSTATAAGVGSAITNRLLNPILAPILAPIDNVIRSLTAPIAEGVRSLLGLPAPVSSGGGGGGGFARQPSGKVPTDVLSFLDQYKYVLIAGAFVIFGTFLILRKRR